MIQVDGRLAADGVAELETICKAQVRGFSLDLANLITIDDSGIAALRELAADGIALLNASPYISLLLQGRRGGRSASP